jgi:hypothetical protein
MAALPLSSSFSITEKQPEKPLHPKFDLPSDLILPLRVKSTSIDIWTPQGLAIVHCDLFIDCMQVKPNKNWYKLILHNIEDYIAWDYKDALKPNPSINTFELKTDPIDTDQCLTHYLFDQNTLKMGFIVNISKFKGMFCGMYLFDGGPSECNKEKEKIKIFTSNFVEMDYLLKMQNPKRR